MMLRAVTVLTLLAIGATEARAQGRWVPVQGGWQPEPQVVSELKAKLQPYVESKAQAQGRKMRTWSEYTFQYQGQEEKGRKYVLVNALCHKDQRWNLEKQVVVIFDGGSCFFHLKFDPQTRRYYDLIINGEA